MMLEEEPMAFTTAPKRGEQLDETFRSDSARLEARAISSQYSKYLTELIDDYDFTEQCKITLKNIVAASFDTNAMLARNESIEERICMLELELNLGIIAMDESDVQNPGFLNINNTIVDAFKDFVSPSLDGWVRKRLGIDKIEHRQMYEGLPSQQPEAVPRGGILPRRSDR